MICVSDYEFSIIKDVIEKYAPDCDVLAFGSRYKWTPKDYSDLDLAFAAEGEFGLKRRSLIEEAFSESSLPYRVDVVDYNGVSPEFRKIIDSGNERIYKGKKGQVEVDGWKNAFLSDFIYFKNGKKRPLRTGEFPVYGGNGILDYADSFNNRNSVIIGRVGAYCGSVYYESSPHWVSDNAISAVNKSNSDILFDYYLLRSLSLNQRHIGTSQPLLTQEILNSITVSLPPISEQIEIGRTLRALDDKITNNTKINHHLEQMTQVAFERFLINDSADEPIGVLSDIAEINPLRSLFRGQETVYVEMANLPTRGSFPTDWTMRPFSGGMKFTNGDTIMARITPCLENGKTAYINFLEEGTVAFGSTEYIVITAKPGYCNEMCYYLARYPDFVSYAVRNMNGSSGRQRVSGDTIGRYKLHIPNAENVREFAEIAVTIMESIRQNALESRNLATIRDTLLPKLMSGELSVADLSNDK